MTILDILTRHVTEFTARMIIADLIKAGVFRGEAKVIDGEFTRDDCGPPMSHYDYMPFDETETTQ